MLGRRQRSRLEQLVQDLTAVFKSILENIRGDVRHADLDVHIVAVHGKGSFCMPPEPITFPEVKMLDVEKVLLSASPTKPDGSPADGVPLTWTSSDPNAVSLEPSEDGLTCWALTPLESGSANVTVSARGFRSVVIPISYAPAVPGELNVSVGNPTLDE